MMTYNEWLNSEEAKKIIADIYLTMSAMHPNKFELDRHLRNAYDDYRLKETYSTQKEDDGKTS